MTTAPIEPDPIPREPTVPAADPGPGAPEPPPGHGPDPDDDEPDEVPD
ncbi:hypothetical protein [Thermomonospora cellulosilytica]|uniref:Uncharacterized protein n=1 Tax=Thermomonospora cellulosilytica TaxID=1411118 RepID=A0A7W3MUR5_9ACTN|nr:hypothetical protein [Thermomonospora cellulosilytica]MBA9002270.1 hypothetical protein [Thermomonospora cellulosilytica]